MSNIESISDYFEAINQLFDNASWECAIKIADLISVRHEHAKCSCLQVTNVDFDDEDDSVIASIVSLHLTVLYFLKLKRYDKAHEFQSEMLRIFNKMVLQKLKAQNWFLPILYQLCSDLRIIARKADVTYAYLDDPEKGSFSEQSTTCVMECYRTCAADLRPGLITSKRIAMMNLTNQLFRIYVRINKLHLLIPLIRAIENCEHLLGSFTLSDKITYHYFLANKSLSFAFNRCPAYFSRNKRLILMYLIPLKMFLGYMPVYQLLEEYNLKEFHGIVDAVNVSIVGSHQVKFETFLCALKWLDVNDIDSSELECIISNLIAEKKIRGYISHKFQTVVLSKVRPFPKLSSIN